MDKKTTMKSFLVMSPWNVLITVLADLAQAKAAARACGGYVVVRSERKAA